MSDEGYVSQERRVAGSCGERPLGEAIEAKRRELFPPDGVPDWERQLPEVCEQCGNPFELSIPPGADPGGSNVRWATLIRLRTAYNKLVCSRDCEIASDAKWRKSSRSESGYCVEVRSEIANPLA